MTDVTAMINANKGNLAPILTTDQSMWEYAGYEAFNIFAVDNSALVSPIGGESNFGQTIRFQIRKRGGRPYNTWLRVDIAAGVLSAGSSAAYMDDLGAGLLEDVTVDYASKVVQSYSGEALKFYQRLMDHDITKEHYFALQQAGLPGNAGTAIRAANVTNGVRLYICLDWLWWTRESQQILTPEAMSSNLEVTIKFRALENVVLGRVTGPAIGNPFTTAPVITQTRLAHQLIFTPKVEATRHLARYENRRGLLFKILDFERQLRQNVAAAAGIYPIKLDNLRLDSSFIMFVVRDSQIDTPWAIDRASSDTTNLTTYGVSNGLQQVIRFRLLANGSVISDWCTDVENRALWRKFYFPGSQINGAVYFIPFGQNLREFKNVFGFQNMANLGSKELEIELAGRTRPSLVDIYDVAHNAIQQAQGDITRALR